MAKAYYGTRISENMTLTPEGFLICHAVPIGRTGFQEYDADDIELPEKTSGRVKISREKDEVFSDSAIASFEGKPLQTLTSTVNTVLRCLKRLTSKANPQESIGKTAGTSAKMLGVLLNKK